MATTLALTIEEPRTARVQTHKGNAGSVDQSSSTYYRLNVFYPFVDNVVTELEIKFSNDHDGLVAVQHLVPVLLEKLTIKIYPRLLWKFLSVDERANLVNEVMKWKKNYENVADKPKSVALALSEYSPQTFPVLRKIFIIYLATPVGSVPCERSFSALRHLKL